MVMRQRPFLYEKKFVEKIQLAETRYCTDYSTTFLYIVTDSKIMHCYIVKTAYTLYYRLNQTSPINHANSTDTGATILQLVISTEFTIKKFSLLITVRYLGNSLFL
jgi:hypothetical protein